MVGQDKFPDTEIRPTGSAAAAPFSKTLKEMGFLLDRLRAKRITPLEADPSEKADGILSFYTRVMTEATGAERCSVFVLDPQRDNVWLKVGTGLQEHEIEVPKEGSIVGKVIDSGEPVVLSDLDAKPGIHKAVDEKTGFVTRSVLCVPIKSPTRDEITGAFEFLNKRGGERFTDKDVALAREAAAHLREAVDLVFLHQELSGISERLYASARKARSFFLFTSAVGLLIVLALMAYVFLAVAIPSVAK